MSSGYVNCACRDCFDVAIASDDSQPALCAECEEAGCDCEGASECERSDAYECDESDDESDDCEALDKPEWSDYFDNDREAGI
jgi:hypothetical protein